MTMIRDVDAFTQEAARTNREEASRRDGGMTAYRDIVADDNAWLEALSSVANDRFDPAMRVDPHTCAQVNEGLSAQAAGPLHSSAWADMGKPVRPQQRVAQP